MRDETLEQGDILNAIADLGKQINERIDGLEKQLNSRIDNLEKRLDAHDAQFEAIRSGLVANHSEFSRLTAKVLNMSADLNDLTEEVRKDRLALK